MAEVGKRDTDWLKRENFTIEIEGITWAHFRSVSGGNIECEFIDYKNSNERFVRKVPGKVKFSNIQLERGFSTDKQFLEWMKSVIDGEPVRKSGSIVAFNDKGAEVSRWNFYEALPAKWEGPDFDSEASAEHIVEKLELVCEYYERDSG